jgi:hypothetical protein
VVRALPSTACQQGEGSRLRVVVGGHGGAGDDMQEAAHIGCHPGCMLGAAHLAEQSSYARYCLLVVNTPWLCCQPLV